MFFVLIVGKSCFFFSLKFKFDPCFFCYQRICDFKFTSFGCFSVFNVVASRVWDATLFDGDVTSQCPPITLFQFMNFFSDEHNCSVIQYVQEVATEGKF